MRAAAAGHVETVRTLLANGAKLVHEPVVTPWGDTTVRLEDADGMQVTLFQVPDQEE